MCRVVMAIAVFNLLVCAYAADDPSRSVPESRRSIHDGSYQEVLRAVRDGRLPKERYKTVVPFLLDVFLERQDSRILRAIARIHQADRQAIESIVPRLAQLIQGPTRTRVLSGVYDLLLDLDSVPPALVRAVKSRTAKRAGKEVTLTDIRAVGVLLKAEPDANEHRASLENLLAHDDKYLRMTAAEVIGCTGDAGKRSIPLLTRLTLQDSSSAVRVMAAQAIWQIQGDPKPAVPVLVSALREPDEPVVVRPTGVSSSGFTQRQIAAALLGIAGTSDPEVVRGLVSVLTEKGDTVLRVYAIRSLEKIGDVDDEALKALQRLRQDPDKIVREAATTALARLARQSPPAKGETSNVKRSKR